MKQIKARPKSFFALGFVVGLMGCSDNARDPLDAASGLPWCRDLGCAVASYSLVCVQTRECFCDLDGRGPEVPIRCEPEPVRSTQ